MSSLQGGLQTVGVFIVSACIGLISANVSRADLWVLSVDPQSTAEPGTEQNYDRVMRLDNDGSQLPDDIPSHSAGLTYPAGIAVGPAGNIYVSSQATGSVLFYDGESGAPLPSPQPGGADGLFASLETASPAQLAFGPDGNLYVSEFFGTIVRVYDPTTGVRLADAASNLTAAGGLAFASNGDLLVGDGFATGAGQSARIVRVSNGVQSTFGISDQGMLSSPVALEFLPNGDLLAADVLGNYVARFDPTGQQFSAFAVIPPDIPDPLPPGVFFPTNSPSDIAFDPDGNIIISVLGLTYPPDNRGALLRYDLLGNFIETIVDGLEPVAGIGWTPDPATASGDYDGDGLVGSSDHAKWAGDFGKFVARGNGADGNGDGVIDAADYVVWRTMLPAGEGAATEIPEPTTLAILLSGSLFGAARGRRLSRAAIR